MTNLRPAVVLALLLAMGSMPLSSADAAVYDQIGDVFNAVVIDNALGVDSQNDVGAPAPFREDFAIAYDSFVFGNTLTLETIDFIGFYGDPDFADFPLASSFDVTIWADDPVTNQPATDNGAVDATTGVPAPIGAPLYQRTFTDAELAPLAIGGTGFFYTADVSGDDFVALADTDYWLSVVANLNVEDNAWGFGFSDAVVGDDQSLQDFAEVITDLPERFTTGADLAFRITAVPEPSSMLAMAAIGGVFAYRRRKSSKRPLTA